MKIVVVGGTGLIGSKFVTRLREHGHDPVAAAPNTGVNTTTEVASEENNRVFRAAAEHQGLPADQIEKLLAASSVAGPATNVQFMVKDSKKYAASGGWGFAQFTNGKPDGEALHKTCFGCHAPGKDHDFVFTRYAP